MQYYSPLRYPGGKAKLAPLLKGIIKANRLLDGHYVEPYAGGAGIAIELLLEEYVRYIHINDLNHGVFNFWNALTSQTEELCKLIIDTPINMASWNKMKPILKSPEKHPPVDVGFAFFFLNRTNRSGVIRGGVIGGNNQEGNYKIDARFDKDALIARIQRIARYKNRIKVYNKDAQLFLTEASSSIPEKSFFFIDPPYVEQGKRLYDNFYKKEDHKSISSVIKGLKHKWVLTYDISDFIEELYKEYRQEHITLQYSVTNAGKGKEVVIYSKGLVVPIKAQKAI